MVALSFFAFMQVAFAAPTDELDQIEKDIQSNQQKNATFTTRSRTLKLEVRALRKELISLSQSVQQRETTVTRLEKHIKSLSHEESVARKSLENRHKQSVDTLIALQRMALNPPEALIAQPQHPSDMVRSAILLRSIVPQIQKQADELRHRVNQYAEKRDLLERQKKSLHHANGSLSDERRRLTNLINEKKTLRKRFVTDSRAAQKQITSLTKRAKSLKDLLSKIAQNRKAQAKKKANKPKTKPARAPTQSDETEIVLGKAPSGIPISKSKGKLSNPASGAVVMKYGQKEKLGGKHKGISIKTRNSAQIIATFDGQIAFAGPFRGYKRLLIIDHGEGYHTLLTGMVRLDVDVGQWLLSGEPVGVMSQNASRDATLYFELRKDGAPINPLPWIRQRNAKARG